MTTTGLLQNLNRKLPLLAEIKRRLKREPRRFFIANWQERRRLISKFFQLSFKAILFRILWILLYPVALILSRKGIRFIDSPTLLTRIGHLALEPYLYIKMGFIRQRPLYKTVLVAPKKEVVNSCLLDYWRPFLKIFENPWQTFFLRPLQGCWPLRYKTCPGPDLKIIKSNGEVVQSRPVEDEIEIQYNELFGNKPLLELSKEHRRRGRNCLEKMGVPKEAWFVCLHVREGSYLPHKTYNSYRDAKIDSYFPAVQEITKRGGWILRTGDMTMTPLPKMEQVIDYAHSDYRSDWMDIFLFADCRFMLGTTSGPWNVSSVFGLPIAATNWIPMGHAPRSKNDIYIPKLYYSIEKKRLLGFGEVFKSPLRGLSETDSYHTNKIKWIDNTKEEIKELVCEMLDRCEGKLKYNEEDEFLQCQYKALFKQNPSYYGSLSRIGRSFVKKYQSLLS